MSLRAVLTLTVGAVLALSLGAFSAIIYGASARSALAQFDERLAEDARTIALMVEEPADGPWEFESSLSDDFGKTAFFEVTMDDGTLLAGTRGLAARVGELPDGRPARLHTAKLAPRPDADRPPPAPTGRLVTVTVARATEEVDASLERLRLLLAAAGLATLALSLLAAVGVIRASLAPLGQLGARVDALGADRLAERLPAERLPAELAPVVRKLNELLGRLEAAFSRERRFTADVSHELRTPLAGLRTVLEVAASRERSAADYQAAIADALQVVTQLHALVENLLLLARLSGGPAELQRADVRLRPLVDGCFAPLAGKAGSRGLAFENRVAEGAVVSSDEARLRIVVSNLLSNAVEYTQAGGRITVESDTASGRVLEVRDTGPPIPDAALEAIFEPFFRVDASRTGTLEHAGIGLSLARALCHALGLSVTAQNHADGQVGFKVTS